MPITTPLLSYLTDSSKIAPMLLIEVPTSAGRTYQGYKRGGKAEAGERIFEESLGAVVWLFGIKAFNKIGDVIGKKALGLKDLDVDVGKDSLRNPFAYISDKKGLTAGYKFAKIIASAVLGTLAMGAVVPKIKVAMSSAVRKKQGLDPYPDRNDKNGIHKENWADRLVKLFINEDNRKKTNLNNMIKMDEFLSKSKSASPNGLDNLAFKGGNPLINGVLFASYNLENNTAWRLLTTDFGTLTGRVANSRTKKEGIEYAVRDSISSLFYIFAAPLFAKGARKAFRVPDIHPKGACQTAQYFKDVIGNKSVKNDFFTSKILSKAAENNLTSTIKFNKNGTISLDDFNLQTNGLYSAKAKLMSELQPKYLSSDGVFKSILSKKQAADVMSDSLLSDPIFLKKSISDITNGKSDDVRAFISRRKLENIRESFDKFSFGLQKYAAKKTNNGVINSELIDRYTKNLNRKNLMLHMSGIAFAVLGLAFLIPKFQYFVSEKITGEKEFLGSVDGFGEKEPVVQ